MAAASRPRESLVRAILPGLELREATAGSGRPVLAGHFSVFNTFTTIRSAWEGTFLERISPGAFKKTIAENRDRMRVLLNHGSDPQLGDKPLGAIKELREDSVGAYYEVDLFDGIPPLVMDGLRAGAYGASFRFSVLNESWDEKPIRSKLNPEGLPERTIKEAKVAEFGPVTFGAYDDATAGVRSLTDRFLLDALSEDPENLRELIQSRRSRTVVTTSPNARVTFTSGGVAVVEDKGTENRADVGALKPLTCAYEALEEFIAMENDVTNPTDAEDVAKAQQALDIITSLIEVEAQEPDDGMEPPDGMEMDSATQDGEQRAPAMPASMTAMPAGVKACAMAGTPGYSGGAACHVHDGTDAGMTAAMTKAKADAAKRSSEPVQPPGVTTPLPGSRKEPGRSVVSTHALTTKSGLLIPNKEGSSRWLL